MRSVPAILLTTITAIAAAAGCSSKNEPAPTSASTAGGPPGWVAVAATSGTRLRASFVTGGGARELVSFHDTQRNEDCTFQPAEGGRTRCLPTSVVSSDSGTFADAACSIPLGVVTIPCAGDAKVAISNRYDQGSCTQVVDTIRKLLPASSGSYVQGPTGCIQRPGTGGPSATATFVPLGEVIPWTEFVEGVPTVIPGSPVAEKVLVTADGARQHLGFRIESLDVDCTFQVMADGLLRCIPDAPLGGVTYSDSECTKPLFVDDYSSSGCGQQKEAKLWIEPTMDACSGARAVFSLRPPTGGDVAPYDGLYSRNMTSIGSGPPVERCSSTGGGSFGVNNARRVVDADVTASLPSAPRINAGDGRLVPALVSLPGGAALSLGWHDTERDIDCTFARASDGKLRCLPTGAQATLLHTDDACKSTGVVAVLDKAQCTGQPRFARVATSACAPTSRLFELGTQKRDLPRASAETTPGRCPILQGVTNALDATEVDPAGFVEGVALTE